MIYSYADCIDKYGSKYQIKKQIDAGNLYQQEKGVYSDEKYIPTFRIVSFKYPKAIFTLNSAFYYHNLTDVIPERYYLATPKSAAKITDERVSQIFENSEAVSYGAEYHTQGGYDILMYNKERMLVELLRNKNKLPFDYYKEILLNYRKIVDELDIALIQDIAFELPKSRMILDLLQMEVL